MPLVGLGRLLKSSNIFSLLSAERPPHKYKGLYFVTIGFALLDVMYWVRHHLVNPDMALRRDLVGDILRMPIIDQIFILLMGITSSCDDSLRKSLQEHRLIVAKSIMLFCIIFFMVIEF